MPGDEELRFRITADDEASRVIEGVAKDVDKLEGKDAKVEVSATDKASPTIDKVETEARNLDGKDASVKITATDKATQQLDEVIQRTKALDQSDATVILKAEKAKAEREVRDFQRLLAKVDGEEATAVLQAKDEATARIRKVQAELDSLDARKAEAQVVGVFGKIKQAATTAATDISSTWVIAMAAIGTAIGVVKEAVGKFQETARTARDLAAATGLSSDEASRWVAVFDDVGVSADNVQGALGKIVKSLDQQKWADYGIATRDAGGNIRPTNDILLDALDALGKIPGTTARAQAGTELFGKAYAGIAPAVGATKKQYQDWLKAVSDGQVITDAEQKKAEDLREAQDSLADAFGDVEIVVGELVADLAPLLRGLAQLVQLSANVADGLDRMHTGETHLSAERMDAWLKNMTELTGSTDKAAARMLSMGADTEELAAALGRAGKEVDGITTSTDAAKDASADYSGVVATLTEQEATAIAGLKDHSEAMANVQAATDDAAQSERAYVDALTAQVDAMESAADSGLAMQKAQERFADAAHKSAEAQRKNKEGTADYAEAVEGERDALIDAAKAARDHAVKTAEGEGKTLSATDKLDALNKSLLTNARVATPAAQRAVVDYMIELNKVPPEKATEIQAAADLGDIDTVERLLNEASRARTATVTADAHTAEAESAMQQLIRDRNAKINVELIAKGAPGYHPRFGPNGEIIVASSAPTPPPVVTPMVAPQTINVNLPRGSRSADIARAMQSHTRRAGRRYLMTPVVTRAHR